MAKYACIWSLIIIILVVLHINLFQGEATIFTIENNCNHTVWPSIVSTGASSSNGPSISYGFSLRSGESRTINTPKSWIGRIVGRTDCSTDTSTGNFSCLSGDCGSGNIDCKGSFSKSPVTLVEFTVGQAQVERDFYDVSVVLGYNLPVSMVPKGGSGSSCAVTGCVFDSDKVCPDDLRVNNINGNNNRILGCRSPCDAFNTSASCCKSASDCKRDGFSLGSLIFKRSCPRAYSYALDDDTSTFSCGGSNVSYTVTFCPPSAVARVLSQSLQSVESSTSPSPSPSITPGINLPNNLTDSPSTSDSKRRKLPVLLVALSTSAAVSILLSFGVWICIRRKVKQTSNLKISEFQRAALDSLHFELSTIRVATNNFSTENKLGEGGFGEVYKGVLESGQEIAVKRLSKNSGQGEVEFKTEVGLVAKLRHKNLVKLLGFCVTFEEKILIYEFLPKSSLDRLLFDSTRQVSLDWQTRFKIIVSIARGLLYLHEDSPIKVIHRDLKPSNILLDEHLNPKIADFGLAKLFGVDQTQGDTRRIVGTYGYMAPEYAITGHFSVKSDVYSFGVLILEIVTGQRSRFAERMQLEEALLHRAWRLWNEDKPLDLVDTTLSNNFPTEEVTKCIHIGLLCIQEDAVVRPRMTSVVAALNGQANSLPVPKPPSFFGTTNNIEDNINMQHAYGVYTGSMTITDLYPRD